MGALALLFRDYTFRTVALGSGFLGIISGVLGSFAVLRKQSLLGDGVSHASLPGVVIAFMLLGSKKTEILLLGALLSGLTATFLINTIVKYTKIKFDSALALVMSVYFGFGMVLLTYVQKIPNSNQAGLKTFIFGQASTLLKRDVDLIAICGILMILMVVVFWKELKIFIFDVDFTQSLGFSSKTLNLLLSTMIVVTIIIGLQTVGVILMSAMLITPAVAARQWTNRLDMMVILAAFFGAICGVAGTAISSMTSKMPTGPVIVICITTIALISILFAPGRGIVYGMYRHKRNRDLLKKDGESDVSTI